MGETKREAAAKAIWAKRPDCIGKPWPLTDEASRRAYPHNPVAAIDLCFTYADAALEAARRIEGEISQAKVTAAAKAACEATKGGLCHFPNCLCEDAARKAIVAALEAAAREV